MDRRTLVYALHILNRQCKNIETRGAEQTAYYDGMRRMLEIIVSEAFTETKAVIYRNGKHTVTTQQAATLKPEQTENKKSL